MFLFGVMGTAGGAVLGHRLERPNAQMVTLGGHLGLLTGAMVGRLTEPDDPADWNQAQRRWALWTIAGDVGGLVAGGLLGARVAPESGRVALTTSGVLWGATAGALLHAGSTDAGLPNPTTVWLGAALGGAAAWLAWEELRIGRAQALIIDAAALVGLLAAPLTWAWWDLNYPREDPTRATALAGGLGVLGGAVLAATLVGRHNQADAATAGAWPQVQITPWAGAGLAVTGRW